MLIVTLLTSSLNRHPCSLATAHYVVSENMFVVGPVSKNMSFDSRGVDLQWRGEVKSQFSCLVNILRCHVTLE